jgi:hypothetical protein
MNVKWFPDGEAACQVDVEDVAEFNVFVMTCAVHPLEKQYIRLQEPFP